MAARLGSRFSVACILCLFTAAILPSSGDVSESRCGYKSPGGRFSVGVVVSGLLERTLPEAVDSLAQNVLLPQVEAGASVYVFVVLQDGRGNKHPQSLYPRPPTAHMARDLYVRRLKKVPGLCHVTFAVTPAPDPARISAEYGFDFDAVMAGMRARLPAKNASRLSSKWARNLFMYHNLQHGYFTAMGYAVTRFGSAAPFDVIVRTRSDNYFFVKHEPYSTYLQQQGGGGGGASVMFPRCREARQEPQIYDKFVLLTNALAADTFYFIIRRHIAAAQRMLAADPQTTSVSNYFMATEILWYQELTAAGLKIERLNTEQLMVSNIAGPPGRPCFRSFETCVPKTAPDKLAAATKASCNAMQLEPSYSKPQQAPARR